MTARRKLSLRERLEESRAALHNLRSWRVVKVLSHSILRYSPRCWHDPRSLRDPRIFLDGGWLEITGNLGDERGYELHLRLPVVELRELLNDYASETALHWEITRHDRSVAQNKKKKLEAQKVA